MIKHPAFWLALMWLFMLAVLTNLEHAVPPLGESATWVLSAYRAWLALMVPTIFIALARGFFNALVNADSPRL